MEEGDVRVLAFDCSTPVGSVAVVEDGEVLFARAFECPRGRGGAFFEVLERAMECGAPARIAVGVGPGSYNGLRTAITAAEALGFATGADIVGLVSLLALPCDVREYLAVADARGGAFSFARIRDRSLVGDVELLSADALHERLAMEPAPVFAPARLADFETVEVATPDAVWLARLGAEEHPAERAVEPFYLKPAHITPPRRGK